MRRLRICPIWFCCCCWSFACFFHGVGVGVWYDGVRPTKRRKIAKYNFIFLDHHPKCVCNPFFRSVSFEYRIEWKKSKKNLSYLSSSSFVYPLYRLVRHVLYAWNSLYHCSLLLFSLLFRLDIFIFSALFPHVARTTQAHTNTHSSSPEYVPKNITSLSYHLKENKASQMPHLRNNRKKSGDNKRYDSMR